MKGKRVGIRFSVAPLRRGRGEEIRRIFNEAALLLTASRIERKVMEVVKLLTSALGAGNKIFICGNGGSAGEAAHFAAELLGRFKKERAALPAIALGSNAPALTAISNDYDFTLAFRRELEALGRKGDMLLAFSTSGNSKNVLEAVGAAEKLGMKTIGFSGLRGKLKNKVDLAITVPSQSTPRIQEVHLVLIHVISELVEDLLFKNAKSS